MGASSGSTPRSDKIRILAPASTALVAPAHKSSMALASAASPPPALKRMGRVTDLKPAWLMYLSLANSSLVRMGDLSLIRLQLIGFGLSKLRSEPMVVSAEVTNSSRMQSMGGLVTWAKSCLK